MKTFDDNGDGSPHWWSVSQRQALLDTIKGSNVIGLFHGHQHESAMIYRQNGLDIIKPKAAYMGGFAIVRVTDGFMDVVLAEAGEVHGEVVFTAAFSKRLG